MKVYESMQQYIYLKKRLDIVLINFKPNSLIPLTFLDYNLFF